MNSTKAFSRVTWAFACPLARASSCGPYEPTSLENALTMDPYQKYEKLKKAWILKHPHASNQEYQNAMRRIAQICGV